MDSLKTQTVRYEVVPVDNCNGRFQNAARALNWGASQATGNWILFAHQDVALLSRDWLERAEETLDQLDSVGWVGVAGRTAAGEQRGFLRNCAALQGLPFSHPDEVQTLDELLLIHRRNSETRDCFDDEVPGWHAYGVDACCDAIRRGKKNYVLPLPVWHDSSGVNLAGLPEAHEFVRQKHGRALGRIHTTCGDLAEAGELADDPGSSLITRVAGRIRNFDLLRHGFRQLAPQWFHETMDSLTAASPLVQCLHDRADQGPIEAEGFGSHPKRRHTIVHTFAGLELEGIRARDVVIAQDLANKLPEAADVLEELKARVERVWLCLSIDDLRRRPRVWRLVTKRSESAMLTSDLEGKLIAVAQIQ
jgi:hypothetical protein